MPQSRRTKAGRPRSRDQVKRLIYQAFRKHFPEDTVDVSDGYKENIHVMVVSREFDRMREREKQDAMWKIIDQTDLSEDEKGLISLVFPVSPAEIK